MVGSVYMEVITATLTTIPTTATIPGAMRAAACEACLEAATILHRTCLRAGPAAATHQVLVPAAAVAVVQARRYVNSNIGF